MLRDVKKSLENYADSLLTFDWRKVKKSFLFEEFLKTNKDELKSAYLGAIICRYWSNINKYSFKDKASASSEDIYNWLLDAALYTLNKQMWLNPKSSVFEDPNGPDKIMNRMIKSYRLGHYEKTNTDKRRLYVNSLSIEGVTETLGDSLALIDQDNNIERFEDPTKDIIIKYFNKKDYFTSFMVYNIISQDVFSKGKNNKQILNEKRLNHLMRNIDESTCFIFSNTFGLKLKEVEDAAKTCNNLSNFRTYTAIKRNLRILAQKEYPYITLES